MQTSRNLNFEDKPDCVSFTIHVWDYNAWPFQFKPNSSSSSDNSSMRKMYEHSLESVKEKWFPSFVYTKIGIVYAHSQRSVNIVWSSVMAMILVGMKWAHACDIQLECVVLSRKIFCIKFFLFLFFFAFYLAWIWIHDLSTAKCHSKLYVLSRCTLALCGDRTYDRSVPVLRFV